MIKVIALDPGETTGWAEGKIESGFMYVRAGQEVWNHIGLYDWIGLKNADYIVCEAFDFRKRAQGVNMYPRELIGVISLFVQQAQKATQKSIDLFMQKPSQGKEYYDDGKLRDGKIYIVGEPHARDAIRHLLQWYTFGFGYQFNKKGFGPWDDGS